MMWVFYIVCAAVYAILGVFSAVLYGFGNTTNYANAKSLFVGLFWPLFWVGTYLYSFGYWVTRR